MVTMSEAAPQDDYTTKGRVLVVDDDASLAEMLTIVLRQEGFDSRMCLRGDEAVEAFRDYRPDVVLLDLMLPGVGGLEVCRRLRALPDRRAEVPVVMLTALGEEGDRVAGLEVGADDYVTKPFSPRELALRVDSVLRRAGVGQDPEPTTVLTDGDLVLDASRHEVTRAGETLALTAREFDLLRFLLAHPGTAWSREDLLERVWGWSVGDLSTVTVHVRRLREKVEADPKQPARLVTVWGVGYRWEPAPA